MTFLKVSIMNRVADSVQPLNCKNMRLEGCMIYRSTNVVLVSLSDGKFVAFQIAWAIFGYDRAQR